MAGRQRPRADLRAERRGAAGPCADRVACADRGGVAGGWAGVAEGGDDEASTGDVLDHGFSRCR